MRTMKIEYYMEGKKISMSKAKELIGDERLEARTQDAIEEHIEDPLTLNTWMDGMEIKVIDD